MFLAWFSVETVIVHEAILIWMKYSIWKVFPSSRLNFGRKEVKWCWIPIIAL